MMKRTLLGLGAMLLATGMLGLSIRDSRAEDDKGGWKTLVSSSAAADLIKDDVKIVTDALKAGKPAAKDQKRAKVSAMLLAIYGAADAKNGGLHAQSMKVIEALNKEDGIEEARSAAAKLASPDSGDAKGDPLKAVWDEANKAYDRDLAMQLFKGTRAGGAGYEKLIKDLAEKNPSPKDLSAVAVMAFKTAILSQAIAKIGPTKSEGGSKTPENWSKFATDLQKAALETGEAAAKKNAASVKAGLNRMDQACVNCHEVFK